MNHYNAAFVVRNNLLFILIFHHVHNVLYGCRKPLNNVYYMYPWHF